jgi:thiamine biosynthesis lipoprotein
MNTISLKPNHKLHLSEVSRSFVAMNSPVEALACVRRADISEAERALDWVQGLFSLSEKQLSRFREDSDLAGLNRSSGKSYAATDLLYAAVSRALDSAALTGGIFDPTILPDLLRAGYDRIFEKLAESRSSASIRPVRVVSDWREIRMDIRSRAIRLPSGCSLDLGGIVKGWTVDLAGRYLEKFRNFAVNAGGDIRLAGCQADGQPWKVGVADPFDCRKNLLVLELCGGAVCTSAITKTGWLSNGVWQHHLIDPRSGLPCDSGLISVTVIAPTAALAETISKAALILGPQAGLELIEDLDRVSGLLVLKDGLLLQSSGFPGG